MRTGAQIAVDGQDPVGVHERGRRGVRHVRGDLQRRPQSGDAGQDRRVYAEVQHVLGVGGIQGGHVEVGESEFRRARHGRRLGPRVVAHHHHGAPVGVGTDEVGVPQGVGGPVQTGRLAVPVAHHALQRGAAGVGGRAQGAGAARQLGAHHGRRAGLLVEGRTVHDVERVEELRTPGQLEVVAGERGSLIAAHQARGEQVLASVQPGTVADRPDERLDTRQEDGAAVAGVAVREGERSGVRPAEPGEVVVGAARGAEKRGHDQHLACVTSWVSSPG